MNLLWFGKYGENERIGVTPGNLKELKILKLTLVIEIISLLYLKEGKHSLNTSFR
jgi:hypothetical protein